MIAIVEYGVGNLFSLQSSLQALGFTVVVSKQPEVLKAAERVILPGVGAFADAMQKLCETGLDAVVLDIAGSGTPLLGICLGMQLLFEESTEFGQHAGLGLIPGRVCSLRQDLQQGGYPYKVPHMGWNPIQILDKNCPLLQYTENYDPMYYVHSYYAKDCDTSLMAYSLYGGVKVAGVVQNNNVFGTQFHPEKSGKAGLAMLKAFGEVGYNANLSGN